jgi:LAO/AO transport system kinase
MEELTQNSRIYIRSLASRRSLDELADNLPDLLAIVENAGFVESILETVGVGQIEYAVRNVVDTIVLVLTPGAGDQIQAVKSGILETADIVVVNKADLPGAYQFVSELAAIVKGGGERRGGWAPPIVPTSIKDRASIDNLAVEIDRHQAWLARQPRGASGRFERRRAACPQSHRTPRWRSH